MTDEDPAARARQWLLSTSSGTLSTISADESIRGFPFGSVVPFALTAEGDPFLYLADIAQHTSNLRSDPRASLLVQERREGDPQAGWRLTLIGRLRERTGSGLEEHVARYRDRVPDAPGYDETHDFTFWQMDLVRVRSIGGFGDIRWLDPRDLRRDPKGAGLAQAAARIVEHMNEDHADALLDVCGAFGPGRPERARMTDVDRAGFLVRTEGPDDLYFIPFGREISADDARDVFVAMTRQAREMRR